MDFLKGSFVSCGYGFPVRVPPLFCITARTCVAAGIAFALVLFPHGSRAMLGKTSRGTGWSGGPFMFHRGFTLNIPDGLLFNLIDSNVEELWVINFTFPFSEPHAFRLLFSPLVCPACIFASFPLDPCWDSAPILSASALQFGWPGVRCSVFTENVCEGNTISNVLGDPPCFPLFRCDPWWDISKAFDNYPSRVIDSDVPHLDVHWSRVSGPSAAFVLPPSVEGVSGCFADVEDPAIGAGEAVNSGVFELVHVYHAIIVSHGKR